MVERYNTPAAIPVAGSAEGEPPPSRAGKGTRHPSFLALLTAEALPPAAPASHAAGSTARRGLPLPARFDFSIQTFSLDGRAGCVEECVEETEHHRPRRALASG